MEYIQYPGALKELDKFKDKKVYMIADKRSYDTFDNVNNFNQTLFTTPQRINCVPYSIDVKNTESVFDLKIKQTNIASEM